MAKHQVFVYVISDTFWLTMLKRPAHSLDWSPILEAVYPTNTPRGISRHPVGNSLKKPNQAIKIVLELTLSLSNELVADFYDGHARELNRDLITTTLLNPSIVGRGRHH